MIIITITTSTTTRLRKDEASGIGIAAAHHHPSITRSQEKKRTISCWSSFFFSRFFFNLFSTCFTRTYSHKKSLTSHHIHTPKSFELEERKQKRKKTSVNSTIKNDFIYVFSQNAKVSSRTAAYFLSFYQKKQSTALYSHLYRNKRNMSFYYSLNERKTRE
jgi:hypothetical protein